MKKMERINLSIGKKFNKLTILSYYGAIKNVRHVNVVCECGKEKVISFGSVFYGKTKSCGCITKKYDFSFDIKKTKIYRSWRSMLGRCFNPNVKRYSIYGARGITVCERWKTFINFYNDMGMPPSDKHSLDRIDNNGDYEPGNCRWATFYEQANNKNNNVFIDVNGKKMSVTEAERFLGFKNGTIKTRLYNGISMEDAIKPVGYFKNKK